MKENKYDDKDFFLAYSKFPRSVEGLRAAGEWHVMEGMLPRFEGKRVLDIGCGFGWHCIYASDKGASYVLGTDISEKMLSVARQKCARADIEYRCAAMEDLEFPDDSFDVVLSSLGFHYTPDFDGMCRKVFRWLSPGGSFVFSAEHPVFTAEGSQQWLESGDKNVWPVDNYFMEGQRNTNFLGSAVVKYHRTLTSYVKSLIDAGFIIGDMAEPQPSPESVETQPGMKDELRRPMMIIFSSRKP